MPVEVWGFIWGGVSFGFMIGGAWVAKFGLGTKPVRALLLANVVMWVIGIGFTIRENIWLTVVGILAWMAIMPVAEAAEQTVLQRVVPYEKQGRVFGFAQAIEVAAVSYTHLDVYKRQVLGTPRLRTPRGLPLSLQLLVD